jgi:hypothetical protein
VEGMLRDDPFTKAGVFEKVQIREWRVVMANAQLCVPIAAKAPVAG